MRISLMKKRSAYFQRRQCLPGGVAQVASQPAPLLILHLQKTLREILHFLRTFDKRPLQFGM